MSKENHKVLTDRLDELVITARLYRVYANFFFFYGVCCAAVAGASLYLEVMWLGVTWGIVASLLLVCGVHAFYRYHLRAKSRDAVRKELHNLHDRSGEHSSESLNNSITSKGHVTNE